MLRAASGRSEYVASNLMKRIVLKGIPKSYGTLINAEKSDDDKNIFVGLNSTSACFDGQLQDFRTVAMT